MRKMGAGNVTFAHSVLSAVLSSGICRAWQQTDLAVAWPRWKTGGVAVAPDLEALGRDELRKRVSLRDEG